MDQITGLLTITGSGADALSIDDSADSNANTATLTDNTLIGLDMPTVQEIQTFRVQAQSGTYRLGVDPLLTGYGAPQTITYDAAGTGPVAVESAMKALFLTDDLTVTEMNRETRNGETHAITYAVTFVRSMAGVDMPEIVWAESRDGSGGLPVTGLVNFADESVEVAIATTREGTTSPSNGNIQTVTVHATAGTFSLQLLDQWTGAIAWDASADDVRTALDPILNPNGSILDPLNPRNDNSKPYTNNVAVTKIGDIFIASRGTRRYGRHLVDTTGLTGTVEMATRVNGINYTTSLRSTSTWQGTTSST